MQLRRLIGYLHFIARSLSSIPAIEGDLFFSSIAYCVYKRIREYEQRKCKWSISLNDRLQFTGRASQLA